MQTTLILGGELVLVALFFAGMFGAAVCDIRSRIIPDKLVLFLGGLWLAHVLLRAFSGSPGWLTDALFALGVAVAFGAVLLLLVTAFEAVSGKPAFGGGDVKLLFVAVLFLRPLKAIPFMFLAFALGLVLALAYRAKGQKTFPFGPAIALASVVAYLL